MNKKIAHKISSEIWRSNDIQFDETLFNDFNLNLQLLQGLHRAGFQKPSEIQLKSIPYGRLGLDLFVQSKSGTGKTCVFAVIVLDSIDLTSNCCQSLILVPTREIASQTHEVFKELGKFMKNLKIRKFIGGNELKKDIDAAKQCHIAIGTPGRLKCLIDLSYLKTNSIRTLVLDEADKLFDDNFTEQINQITVQLPISKQTLLVTATSTGNLFNFINQNMKGAKHIKIDYEKVCLLGVDQFYWNLGFLSNEHFDDILIDKLLIILKNVVFSQCIIFLNSEARSAVIKSKLIENRWSTEMINGRYQQKIRDKILRSMKSFDFKILLCTDLIARGIDCEDVNLVINLDVPNELETYLHRVGRCGRFGQHGIAITICSRLSDFNSFNLIKQHLGDDLNELPDLETNDLWNFKDKTKSNLLISLDELTKVRAPSASSKYLNFDQLASNYESFKNSC